MTKNTHPHAKRGLRLIATFEAAKGLLVLVAGFRLLTLAHGELQAIGESLVARLHLNPAAGLPRIFLSTLANVREHQLWLVAAGAAAYAALRFAEAWGLWYGRRWAEWLGVVSAGIYLPFEVRELWRDPSALHLGILAVNLAIVAYLGRELARRRSEAG